MLRKQLRILLAGVFVLVPFAVTLYVICLLAMWLGRLGEGIVQVAMGRNPWEAPPVMLIGTVNVEPVVGGLVLLILVYVVGLLTRLWLFDKLLLKVEGILGRMPGIKTIYESIRDLLALFGPASSGAGKVVLYQPPGSPAKMLGIMTNEQPAAMTVAGEPLVALYLPLAYMIGGPILYVPREHVRQIDMKVEQALRICATAEITTRSTADGVVDAALGPSPEAAEPARESGSSHV